MIDGFNRLAPPTKFFWLLLIGNMIFIGCYFSGISALQQFVAPTIHKANFSFTQMREFGALEMTQNILLLTIIYVLASAARQSETFFLKAFFGAGVAAFIFLFLEELDYGLHFYKFFSVELADTPYFSWHNQWDSGENENATRLKRVNDAINVLWFVIIPLLFKWAGSEKKSTNFFFDIIPSIWFPIGFFLAFICSKGAHQLDDMGLGMIDGVQGNLNQTIAEFRETSIYYLYLIYAIQLFYLKNSQQAKEKPSNYD
jgi:hypothetical protein